MTTGDEAVYNILNAILDSWNGREPGYVSPEGNGDMYVDYRPILYLARSVVDHVRESLSSMAGKRIF